MANENKNKMNNLIEISNFEASGYISLWLAYAINNISNIDGITK